MASTTIQVRMDTKVKQQLETLLKDMGLNMTTAVNLFAHAVINQQKIPFEITPNKHQPSIIQDLEDVRAERNLSKTFHSPEELFAELGI